MTLATRWDLATFIVASMPIASIHSGSQKQVEANQENNPKLLLNRHPQMFPGINQKSSRSLHQQGTAPDLRPSHCSYIYSFIAVSGY